MRRNLVLLDLLMLGLAVFLASQFKTQWRKYQTEYNLDLLNPKVDQGNPAQKPSSSAAEVANYSAIVDQNLFSTDRNNVLPPEPNATKSVGPKPILMGTMGLSGTQFALMIPSDSKEAPNYQKVNVGEVFQGYTLLKVLDQKVLMKADGQEVEVQINEPKKTPIREYTQAGANPGGAERVTSVGAGPAVSGLPGPNQAPRVEAVPVGTVVNGKKKTLVPSPFGPMEAWVDTK